MTILLFYKFALFVAFIYFVSLIIFSPSDTFSKICVAHIAQRRGVKPHLKQGWLVSVGFE